jgi:hypothetical protein
MRRVTISVAWPWPQYSNATPKANARERRMEKALLADLAVNWRETSTPIGMLSL